MPSIRIYAMTHKKFEVPKDPMYIPLQVGREGKEDLGYTGDHTGDNISGQNRYFSELTGIYWVLKNACDTDYVGVCHYRRYPLNEQDLVLSKREYEQIFQSYDVIASKVIELRVPYYDGYKADHHIGDLLALEEILRTDYPEYYEVFEDAVHKNRTYFGNIMVASAEVFRAYHNWLFEVLFKLQERIQDHLEDASYDDYHRRVYGFLSEFLMYVWLEKQDLKVYETKIGIIGEKAETKEVKTTLSKMLSEKDIQGAKAFFTESLKKRPDLLMEVSDITGELKMLMQVIAACDLEYQRTGKSMLDRETDTKKLISYFNRINQLVLHAKAGLKAEQPEHEQAGQTEHEKAGPKTGQQFLTEEEQKQLRELEPSDTVLEVACRVCCDGEAEMEDLRKKLICTKIRN